MTIWESPVTNPREYPAPVEMPPRWVLVRVLRAVALLAVLVGLLVWGGGVWHDGSMAERRVSR